MSETGDKPDDAPEGQPAGNAQADRTDRVANALERLAYKIHDLGNWLMGFLR